MVNYLLSGCFTCFYKEGSNILSMGEISTLKLKSTHHKPSSIVQSVTHSSMFGYFLKCRVVGRGYKILNHLYVTVFKMGYAHSVFLVNSVSLYSLGKEKKQRFYSFFSSRMNTLVSAKISIPSIRKIDVYSKKGLYLQHQSVNFKQGKKAFSF